MAQRQNHLKKMELRKKAKEDAGLVSDRFPQVTGMVIHMTYYQNPENRVLMERTVNIFPSSAAYFSMDCMTRGCDEGGFDLTSVISRQIKNHKKLATGTMNCKGKNGDLGPNHASCSYEVKIKYRRRSR